MSKLEALFLGIIQGLTEFLPVSSSGHLELAKHLIGNQALPGESLLFTVIVHFATALATIVIYKKEVLQILVGLSKRENNEEFKFSLSIIISMIPAAIVGIVFDDFIETLFNDQILLVGFMLLITGLLLAFANNATSGDKPLTYKNAIFIGIAQAIAILPGISRSGATISSSILLGMDREKASRFSFLMVVPLIFGKMAKDIMDGAFETTVNSPLNLVLAFAAAFLTGLWACKWMIEIVKRSNLNYFSLYCFAIGIVAIIASFGTA